MIKLLHLVAQTNVLPLKCRQQSWCEPRMYTNELCCRMLLWWLPSLLGIDPSRVKTGRKETGNQQQQRGVLLWHHTKFKVFLGMFSQTTETPGDRNLNYINIIFHWINVNPSMKIIHGRFAFGSFGSCLWVWSQRWVVSPQLMITKQSAPCSPRTHSRARCVLTD